MVKVVWASDIHLDFAENDNFFVDLKKASADYVLISGDIGAGNTTIAHLKRLTSLDTKILFVLGNHDFYESSLAHTSTVISEFVKSCHNLVWLTQSDPIEIAPDTYCVGSDGWYDGRAAYAPFLPPMRDFDFIDDFRGKSMPAVREKMAQIADKFNKELCDKINKLLERNPKKIFVVTHVPPFKYSALHNGQSAGDSGLQTFVNHTLGVKLAEFAAQHLLTEWVILSGHTHAGFCEQPERNLSVNVAAAVYGKPKIAGSFIVDVE